LEIGYRIATRYIGITPYLAGQVQTFRTPSYSEAAASGTNTFALSYNSRSTTATRFELGSWLDKLFALDNGHAILLRGRAAWAHDEGGNGGINAAFQTLPGAAFTVNGAAPPKDLVLASAGGELRLRNNISLGAKFDGEFGSTAQTYAGTGTARYVW
jgi:outer membrane autotransporter protein